MPVLVCLFTIRAAVSAISFIFTALRVCWKQLLLLMGSVMLSYMCPEYRIIRFLVLGSAVYLFSSMFRFFVWDFTAPFSFIYRKCTCHRIKSLSGKWNFLLFKIGGTVLSCILSFLLIISIGYIRPRANDTFRYKQVHYEAGDHVLVGEVPYMAVGMKRDVVLKVVPETAKDGTVNRYYASYQYVLQSGKTVPHSRICGMEAPRDGLAWIPEAYFLGGKYLFQTTCENIAEMINGSN